MSTAVQPHTGRGGWTWYTGSAGWMYRLITESLLGTAIWKSTNSASRRVRLAHWPSFKIHYRYRETFYHITIQNGGEAATIRRLAIDGVDQSQHVVPLVNDHTDHVVEIELA